MSLKVGDGTPVACIQGQNVFVGVFPPNPSDKRPVTEMHLNPKGNEKYMMMPEINKRSKIFIAGPTGCGKTYLALQIMDIYKEIFPENSCFMITADSNDKSISLVGPEDLQVLDLKDDEVIYDPELVDAELYKKSILFIDDIEYLADAALTRKLKKLTKNVLGIGRHFDTSVIISAHLVMNYHTTRFILSEADYVIVFPGCGSTKFVDNFFKSYFSGINSHIRSKIYHSGSRWAICRMTFPQAVILEKDIYVLTREVE